MTQITFWRSATKYWRPFLVHKRGVCNAAFS
jgi:hypothetical protein